MTDRPEVGDYDRESRYNNQYCLYLCPPFLFHISETLIALTPSKSRSILESRPMMLDRLAVSCLIPSLKTFSEEVDIFIFLLSFLCFFTSRLG